jgi:hypothetical protein
VFERRSTAGSLACGVLRPQLRWSKRIARHCCGLKAPRQLTLQPELPWTMSTGLPAGLPHCSQ